MAPKVAGHGTEGAEGKLYLGYYMPFAGVRYYALFTEEEVRRGAHRVGPVGWRRAGSHGRGEELAPAA